MDTFTKEHIMDSGVMYTVSVSDPAEEEVMSGPPRILALVDTRNTRTGDDTYNQHDD
jgi:hypothetical protein